MLDTYTGKYDLGFEDQIYILQFTWARLAQLKSKYPALDFQDMLQSQNPQIIADMVEVGTGGELKAQTLLDSTTPIVPILSALSEAVTFAFLGIDQPEEPSGEDKKK